MIGKGWGARAWPLRYARPGGANAGGVHRATVTLQGEGFHVTDMTNDRRLGRLEGTLHVTRHTVAALLTAVEEQLPEEGVDMVVMEPVIDQLKSTLDMLDAVLGGKGE